MHWKDRISQLNAQLDFIQHPVAQEWKKGKIMEIQRINSQLANNPDLSDQQRQRLFGEKKAHEFDLGYLQKDPRPELEIIEKAVDDENNSSNY
ncbi:MAG: hypothetical protein QMD65_02050 [Patescibacteria group bacterium]|nr:hypothetical protein [Patescibacteria group bacterium]